MFKDSLKKKVDSFLDFEKLAICGVSLDSKNSVANIVCNKLMSAGYTVYGVNPKVGQAEDDTRYPDLKSLPEPVGGVFAATKPEDTLKIAEECRQQGIEYLWLHRSFGTGSVSDETVDFCNKQGINVIAGGCPMMFCEPVDIAHKCIRGWLSLTNKLPA